ncbi:unnamed protein product, partial [marine sediment metagenome]
MKAFGRDPKSVLVGGAGNRFVRTDSEGLLVESDIGPGDSQTQGDVLDDINTVGQVGADSEFLVGTEAGTLAWEKDATVRASLGLGIGDNPTFT